MKYVKTFEELNWKFKSPKNIVSGIVKELNPFDKNKKLNKKIDQAIKKINIHGLNFTKKENSSQILYSSIIDLQINIPGYIHSELFISRHFESNYLKIELDMKFNTNLSSAYSRLNRNGISYVYYVQSNSKNLKIIIESCIGITHEDTMDDMKRYIESSIDDIVNIDQEDIKKDLDTIKKSQIEKKKSETEYSNKVNNLKDKIEEISDCLIDLEEMSIKHDMEFEDEMAILTYDISGIEIDESDNKTARLVINDTLIDIMTIIKTFKKRIEKEIQGVIVKSSFSKDKIKIKILPEERNKIKGYSSRRRLY
jgi:hypothetical protein